MTNNFNAILVAFVLLDLGCSNQTAYVPVSGVITLDGKPYSKAVISFQPVGSKDSPNPGRGSSAYTDDNGRFELKCDGTVNGAVVGKHLIRIMTKGSDVIKIDPLKGSSDEAPVRRNVDPIPPEWNGLSNVEFEVPIGGTDKANFDILTKKLP